MAPLSIRAQCSLVCSVVSFIRNYINIIYSSEVFLLCLRRDIFISGEESLEGSFIDEAESLCPEGTFFAQQY